MLTVMIIMDCLHFANYFVPLIHNGELSQSALKGRRRLIAFAKSMAGLFFLLLLCFLFFFFPLSFCGSIKDWIRFNNSDTFLSKQTGPCQWRGLTESCHTVLEADGDRVSAPTASSAEPSPKPFPSPRRKPRPPFSESRRSECDKLSRVPLFQHLHKQKNKLRPALWKLAPIERRLRVRRCCFLFCFSPPSRCARSPAWIHSGH